MTKIIHGVIGYPTDTENEEISIFESENKNWCGDVEPDDFIIFKGTAFRYKIIDFLADKYKVPTENVVLWNYNPLEGEWQPVELW